MLVPIIMIGLIVVLWAVLAGMPFGGDGDEPIRPKRAEVDVVNENPSLTPVQTRTVAENVPPMLEPQPQVLQPQPLPQTVPPPMTSATPPATETVVTPQPQPIPQTQPPILQPRPQTPPARTPQPQPTPPPPQPRPKPAPEPDEKPREMSESQAIALLRNYIGSREQYGSSTDCVIVGSEGYSNRGYTLYARDRCDNHEYGRWRVDAVTREVFREKGGRFLKP